MSIAGWLGASRLAQPIEFLDISVNAILPQSLKLYDLINGISKDLLLFDLRLARADHDP
jgi:hypothetical protein